MNRYVTSLQESVNDCGAPRSWSLLPFKCTLGALLVAAILAAPASAEVIPVGTLTNYSIISVGTGASITMNSGPVGGVVLLGAGTTSSSSGGNNGAIPGGVQVSPPVSGDNLTHLQNPVVVTMVPSTVGTTALSDAIALSSFAAGLTATQTFGAINGTQVITGNGDTNVINIASLHNPTLTLSGGPNDVFIINVSGSFQTNHPVTLVGITPSQILWNFTGTGTVLQTSGGAVLPGTFLTTHGGQFNLDNVDVMGALINATGNITFVSGAHLEFLPFTPPEEIPEPGTLALLGAGLATVVGVRQRSLRK